MQYNLKNIISIILFSFIFPLSTSCAHVRETTNPNLPKINADSYILIDYASGKVLAEHDAEQKVEPASLTKLMTMYIIDQHLAKGLINTNDKVLISRKAWKMSGSRMFVEAGKQIPVKELIKGIIIQSGNDATVAMTEHVAGSEEGFVSLMNNEAKRLHMENSHFGNATGLPMSNHYSTAKDLALLSRAIIHDFPNSYRIYSQKYFVFNGIKQYNRNKLLWLKLNADGIKTGYTSSAGYCLVGSAKQGNTRLISIVLGAPNNSERTKASATLLKYGFHNFITRKIYDANEIVRHAKVWLGNHHELNIATTEDFYLTLPRLQANNIKVKINLPQHLKAPIKLNQKLGTVDVSLNDKIIASKNLYSMNEISSGNLIHRTKDYLQMSWNNLFDN